MSRLRDKLSSLGETLGRAIPLVSQLRTYDGTKARGDVVAGITTAVLLLPQSMAYAMLAGLPPVVGLYAATLPLLIYALVGSSAHLSVGPVALVSLVVFDSVSALASPGSADYMALAVMLALMVGVIQLAMGVLRLGFVVDLLSHPVMIGFTAAAAVLISLTQLGPLLGIDLESTQKIHWVVLEVVRRVGEVDLVTLAMAAASIATLLVMRWKWPKGPRALIVLGIAAALVWGSVVEGIAVVGEIPAGIPGLSLPHFDLSWVIELLPAAATILVVGFMEAFAVAKVTAREAGEMVVPERELAGLGSANLAASLVGAYPVGGAFSRTAVNARSGAQTNLAGVFTALVVVATLLLLTPVFRFVPRVVLAAIIVVAVSGLFDAAEFVRLFRVDRRDFALAMLTFLVTLTFGLELGVGLGVVASLAVFVFRVARPKIHELGWLPDMASFRSRSRNMNAEPINGVLTLRVQAPAFFANARYVRDKVVALVDASEHAQTVVIDAGAIDHLDASAERELVGLIEDLEHREIVLRLAQVTAEVYETLERSGLREQLGDRVHATLDDAMSAATGGRHPLDSRRLLRRSSPMRRATPRSKPHRSSTRRERANSRDCPEERERRKNTDMVLDEVLREYDAQSTAEPTTLDLQIQSAEDEGMVTEAAKVSACEGRLPSSAHPACS